MVIFLFMVVLGKRVVELMAGESNYNIMASTNVTTVIIVVYLL